MFQYISMQVFLLVFILLYAFHASGQADPPEYVSYWTRLKDIGQKQASEYLYDSFLMPQVSNNPSITPWLFDDDSNHPNFLISWCSSVYACMYYVVSLDFDHLQKKLLWKIVKTMDSFEYFDDHNGLNRKPLNEFRGDIRLWQADVNTTRLTYNQFRGKYQDSYIARLFYHKVLDALYIISNPSKINIISEHGDITQKNWSPFVYHHQHAPHHNGDGNTSHSPDGQHLLKNYSSNTIEATNSLRRRLSTIHGSGRRGDELFVYSIYPHQIVHSNETLPTATGTDVVFHTLCSTQVRLPDGQTVFWKYGDPRGGSPSVLIDTVFGPRYLTFFHSQGNFAVPYILTYYFGAYLFEAQPPFAITHMTVDPIIPLELYDEKHGWAFKATDYIVFPTGLVVKEGLAYVTVGRNDKSGWMLVMNVTGLVSSLTPVSSDTISSTFHNHFKHANGHEDSQKQQQ